MDKGFKGIKIGVVFTIIVVIVAISMPRVRITIRNFFSPGHSRVSTLQSNVNAAVQFIPDPNGGQGNYVSFNDNGAGGGIAGNGILDGTEKVLQRGTMRYLHHQ